MTRAYIYNNDIFGFGSYEELTENVYQVNNPHGLVLSTDHRYDFMISDNVCTLLGYRQTIQGIATNWQSDYADYKQAREKLKTFADGRELTIEEARILARWFVLPVSNIITLLTEEEIDQASDVFNNESIASRAARLKAVIKFIRLKIGLSFSEQVLSEIAPGRLDDLYINYGREGTMKISFDSDKPDPDGLFDYVLGTGIFTGKGLPALALPEGCPFTMQQVQEKAMDILDRGNY